MKTSSRWEGAAPRHHWAKLENTTTYSWIPSGPAFVDEGECSERAMRCAVPAGSAVVVQGICQGIVFRDYVSRTFQ